MLTNLQFLCVAIPTLAVKRSVISTNLLLDSLKLCNIPSSRRCIQCRYSSAVVEQLTCNQQVPSSTLGGGTISFFSRTAKRFPVLVLIDRNSFKDRDFQKDLSDVDRLYSRIYAYFLVFDPDRKSVV